MQDWEQRLDRIIRNIITQDNLEYDTYRMVPLKFNGYGGLILWRSVLSSNSRAKNSLTTIEMDDAGLLDPQSMRVDCCE
jgi:hypothetical protein